MIARLKSLHADDCSFGVIAETMSRDFRITISRNAAIGKAGRLGLTTRVRVPTTTAERAYKPAGKVRKTFRPQRPKSLLARAEELITSEAVRLPPDHSPFAVSFLELEQHHCRWPIGE